VSALCKKTHPRLGHAWAPLNKKNPRIFKTAGEIRPEKKEKICEWKEAK